ncbi:MAG: hypothetical protein U5R46_14410 [Gammaproteobacteria bacterium]|nr:hypothetical protein [Gammaproteobacteria bacterium]
MRIIACVVSGLMLTMQSATAADDRLLFDNPGYTVTMPDSHYCDDTVALTVHSDRPGLFESGSPELQRIVDAAQAVLAFECPEFHAIQVDGRLSGIGEPVYTGLSERRSNWELAATQSIQSEQYDGSSEPMDDEGYGAADASHGFSVANLSPGMPVEEARSAVTETFGIEPEFDIDSGVLTMLAGGCPADYDWAALSPEPERGWKCLNAWFTDQRLARLYLLDLVQVVDAADPEAVAQQLMERFGEPVYRDSREQEGGWWGKDEEIRMLAWGEVVETRDTGDGEMIDVYTLQVKILPVDDVTVVTVTLYEPELRPGRQSGSGSKVPDLTL